MTLTQTASALDADAIGRISDRLDEPDWLRALRARWWERASTTPPPTGQEEEWRRTSLDALPRDVELLLDVPQLEAHLPPDAAEAGVILTDLRTAIREHPELVERFLGQADGPDSHAHFWALAQSAWTGGLFCYVPARRRRRRHPGRATGAAASRRRLPSGQPGRGRGRQLQ